MDLVFFTKSKIAKTSYVGANDKVLKRTTQKI